MKIIFLDIDGVLNYAGMPKEDRVSSEFPFRMLSKSRVAELNKLTDVTGAKIVVSSSWRKNRDFDHIFDILTKAGVSGEVIDQTPENDSMGRVRTFRGNEIYQWMANNSSLIGSTPSEYREYVILDDDSDFLMWQSGNFVQTDNYIGLSPQAAHKAKRVLVGKTRPAC